MVGGVTIETLDIKIKYSTDKDDILKDFYLPILKNSTDYKRAVGYFSSEILIEYMSSLRNFYENSGKMKLIISPQLSEDDIAALGKGNEFQEGLTSNAIKAVENQLMKYFESSNLLKTSSELFFLLIVNNTLEVKIAIPKKTSGLFHEKIGIFHLKNGEKVAINGSNNETFRSISVNHESFNTFCSWKKGQEDYIEEHEKDFDRYWNNKSHNLNVVDINSEFVVSAYSKIEDKSIEKRFSELEKEIFKETERETEFKKLGFQPYDYQENAAQKLLNNKGGILEFATGSGKTKTAIYFMELLKKEKAKSFFVVVVPDKTLMEQWAEELSEYNENVLKCYSENPRWLGTFRNMIDIYNSPLVSNQVVVVTNQTMFRNGEESRFLKQLRKLNGDFTLIVDELHRWSTEMITNNMPESSYRVGLSATPFNTPKTVHDARIERHFRGIIAQYDLGDAIRDEKLVPYNYYPIFITLNEFELAEYRKISQQLVKLQGIYDKEKTADLLKAIELKRFERSRIIYGAANKITKLGQMLESQEIEQKNLLIYCGATNYIEEERYEDDTESDALTQLEAVNSLLKEMGIVSAQYTQQESTDERQRNIELFTQETLSTLSAIKCLDEGVDIPQIENAVILASSSNRREFVQRRGRVLRRSPGKTYSNIYDFVVFDDSDNNSHINKIERARVLEFIDLAMNKNNLEKEFKEYLEGEIYD